MTEWLVSPNNDQTRYEPGVIDVSLLTLREAVNFDVSNIVANGGILASDTTPILEAISAATDGCQRLLWAANNNDQVVIQVPLPADLDDTKDIVLHTEIASAGTTDAVGFTVDWFIDEADTKVVDTSQTNQTTTFGDKLTELGNADIPAGARKITIGLTPVGHTTDDMYLTAIKLVYAKRVTGVAIDLSDFYGCKIWVPYAHKLVAARVYTPNVVTTGIVEVKLMKTAVGFPRGGALVGVKLENDVLDGPKTNVVTRYDITLTAADKLLTPEWQQYFLFVSGTDNADRFEEPTLAIEVEKV